MDGCRMLLIYQQYGYEATIEFRNTQGMIRYLQHFYSLWSICSPTISYSATKSCYILGKALKKCHDSHKSSRKNLLSYVEPLWTNKPFSVHTDSQRILCYNWGCTQPHIVTKLTQIRTTLLTPSLG